MGVTEIVQPFETHVAVLGADAAGQLDLSLPLRHASLDLVALDTRTATLDAPMQSIIRSERAAPDVRARAWASPSRRRAAGRRRRNADGPFASSSARQANVYGTAAGMAFVVTDGAQPSDTASLPMPGPTLVLERGKRVASHDRQHVERARGGALARHRARELSGRRAGMERIGEAHSAVDRAGRLAHGALDAAARRHVHVPLALQRSEADGQRAVRADHRAGAGREVRSGDGQDRCSSARPAPATNPVFGSVPEFVMNGKTQPEPMDLKADTQYRFRLFNLAGDTPLEVSTERRRRAGQVAGRWQRTDIRCPHRRRHSRAARWSFRSRRDLRFRVHTGRAAAN